MKIEMGESLLYSWMRHIKECQLVQTNWKVSGNWNILNENKLELMYDEIVKGFNSKIGVNLFKKIANFSQLIKQGECDVMGICVGKNISYYACDVAFHENGLNYGSKNETILKVVSKCVRTAFCLYGFFDTTKAEVIFATPFASDKIKKVIEKYLMHIENYFKFNGLDYTFKMISDDDFNNIILEPVLVACKGTADTSELFARSYKLIQMFTKKKHKVSKTSSTTISVITPSKTAYSTMKIGTIVKTEMFNILETKINKKELYDLLDADKSKDQFGLRFPVLTTSRDPQRYYSTPINIFGTDYYVCNDWYERNKDNLIDWILKH